MIKSRRDLLSVVLHVGEVFGVLNAFFYFVTVLHMLHEAADAGVEDVGKTVLAEILLGKNPEGLSEFIVVLEP